VAGELGFEPRLTESESAVLPLNYSPSTVRQYLDIFGSFTIRREKFYKFGPLFTRRRRPSGRFLFRFRGKRTSFRSCPTSENDPRAEFRREWRPSTADYEPVGPRCKYGRRLGARSRTPAARGESAGPRALVSVSAKYSRAKSLVGAGSGWGPMWRDGEPASGRTPPIVTTQPVLR
jgi:hypothetical protein